MPKGKQKNNKRPPSQFVNMTDHMKNTVKHAKMQIRETKNTLPETIVTTLQPTTSEVTIDTSQSKALEELKQILKKKEEEIQRLKMSKRVKRQRKKRIFTQKDWQVRNVTKQRIFRKVKFITSKEQLDEFAKAVVKAAVPLAKRMAQGFSKNVGKIPSKNLSLSGKVTKTVEKIKPFMSGAKQKLNSVVDKIKT